MVSFQYMLLELQLPDLLTKAHLELNIVSISPNSVLLTRHKFEGVLMYFVRNLDIFNFNLIQKNSAIYAMTCMCMCV
jgi:hypothetical protein